MANTATVRSESRSVRPLSYTPCLLAILFTCLSGGCDVRTCHRKKVRGLDILHLLSGRTDGPAFVSLAIAISVLIILLGLAIDLDRAHVANKALFKASDAAALAAVSNLNQGQAEAGAQARNAFGVNFQPPPGLRSVSTPTVTWFSGSPCIANNTCVSVTATGEVNARFLRVLGVDTLKIAGRATAQRTPVVVSLVLDRSGSMLYNGGAKALPPAVIDFTRHFADGIDNLAEISFSSIASVDVPMTTSFGSPIKDSLESMRFGGATFAQAGLQDGYDQLVERPFTPNSIRIAVFFTDGWANTINDKLNCFGSPYNPIDMSVNYGGCAPLEAAVGLCGPRIFFMDPESGGMIFCPRAFSFPSQQPPGGKLSINQSNITNEATYRTEKLADTMRNTANRITVYSIGMGDKINQTYLQAIANDPAALAYNPNQASGVAVFASSADQLDEVFQAVASKITSKLSE